MFFFKALNSMSYLTFCFWNILKQKLNFEKYFYQGDIKKYFYEKYFYYLEILFIIFSNNNFVPP